MARPNIVAKRKASALATGRVPGMAKSIAQAWVLGSAPKAVLAPENILLLVASCTCTSNPITVSHSITIISFVLRHPAVPISIPVYLMAPTQSPAQPVRGNQLPVEIDERYSTVLLQQNNCRSVAIPPACYPPDHREWTDPAAPPCWWRWC